VSGARGGPIDLVVTDLDGTLWHTDDDVAPAVVDAVRTLDERGVPLLVATGRRVASTRAPLARVGLAPPAVVLNGALGLDLATGERFHRAPYAADEAAAVLAAFRSAGLDPVVYLDHPTLDAVLSATPSTHPEHARQLGAPTADLDTVVATEAVLGFSVIGVEHGRCVAARDAVGDRAETHLDRSLEFPGYATLTVAPTGQSKWDGCSRSVPPGASTRDGSSPWATAPTTSSSSPGPLWPWSRPWPTPTPWPPPTTSSPPPPTPAGPPSSTTSEDHEVPGTSWSYRH
jgi:hypothetical protein